jgi:hypothetical protein
MKKTILILSLIFWNVNGVKSQDDFFPFRLEINPINIPKLPGLHSYAFAQHDEKWLIIGGRRDGLHARQANTSFPASFNNSEIFVIDIAERKFWKSSLDPLPVDLKEQLQSTNMNFYQDGSMLIIIGGYAYSASRNRHITFPFITTVNVPSLIEAVIEQEDIQSYFFQIPDERFAVTGGQLGKIGETLILVGGHRFDGRYNPMGGPSYVQVYTNQIKKFKLATSIAPFGIIEYEEITDPVHLRRRDYNLVPQVFPDGEEGYMISSGVFQINADLPFLYPVDIKGSRYFPRTSFNQYLSNYHAPKVALYDQESKQMHALFFGGMSQYYYESGELIEDNRVPFTKSISRITRFENDSLAEYLMPLEMPALQTASAEFLINPELPQHQNKIIRLNELDSESLTLGHILGGISSPSRNPFFNNQTNMTSAASTVYEVKLIKSPITNLPKIDGSNPYLISVFPNPFDDLISVRFHADKNVKVDFFVTNTKGQMIREGTFYSTHSGNNEKTIGLDSQIKSDLLVITFVFENKFFISKTLVSN